MCMRFARTPKDPTNVTAKTDSRATDVIVPVSSHLILIVGIKHLHTKRVTFLKPSKSNCMILTTTTTAFFRFGSRCSAGGRNVSSRTSLTPAKGIVHESPTVSSMGRMRLHARNSYRILQMPWVVHWRRRRALRTTRW